MRILHLIDVLDSSDASRQLRWLGPSFGGAEVCCVGPDTPWADSLREAGIVVHTLNWTRWLDASVVWNLRAIVHSALPDLIHVWSLPALRFLAVVARNWLPRVVLSATFPPKGETPWYDRWLLRQVRCITVGSGRDQESCLRQGVAAPAVCLVPPAVSEAEETPSEGEHAEGRTIVCAGPLEREAGVRTAIWAFDIVHYLFPESRLVIAGAGSQEGSLRSLVQGLQNDGIDFLGPQTDLGPVLRSADVVWIPSAADCGRQTALEAMAHGKAVIASAVPSLCDVIGDGATGFLVPPGDVVALGRRTRLLFQDHALRRRLGEEARQAVRQRFPVTPAIERWHEVYRGAAMSLTA